MQKLLEDYKRRLETVMSEYETAIREWEIPADDIIRLETKAYMMRTFIAELEREVAGQKAALGEAWDAGYNRRFFEIYGGSIEPNKNDAINSLVK